MILRATHILTLTVLSLDEGPWQGAPRGGRSQSFRAVARVNATLAGQPIAKPGAEVSIAGTRSQPGPRDSYGPGVWSEVELSPGTQLLVLSRASTSTATAVLAESAVMAVLPAEPAAEEVRHVLRLDRSAAGLADALRSLSEPPALTTLFAEYLVARLQQHTLYADAPGFDKVMSWLEADGRSPAVQRHVIEALTAQLLSAPPPRSGFAERLALAEWRLLAKTADETLASQIETTFLPNLLGLEGSAKPVPVQTVFGKDSGERQRLAEALRHRPASPSRARLLGWLGG